MAKNYCLALGCLALCLSLNTANAVAAAPAGEEQVRTELVALASSQVGVREQGGDNRGPQVRQYLASSGNREGEPWCAAFICWCFKKLGLSVPPNAGAARNWFPASRVIYRKGSSPTREPKAGDLAGFYYVNLGRIGHIGQIQRWEENFVVTVEGNTGGGAGVNRNGDSVRRMRRLKSQITVVSNWVPKS